MPMSRWKAAGIHLSANAIIAVFALGLIFLVWYPQPYSQAAGAGTLALLLLGVDLVLGPLLTLVVYKAGKKGLKFDLTLIVLLQLCAFAYGMHVVALARPAFIVGVVDRLVLVTANELEPKDLAQAAPSYRSIPWTGPLLVGAPLPTDPIQSNEVLTSGLAGKDIERLPKYYQNYSTVVSGLLERAVPLEQFERKYADVSPTIQQWLHEHPQLASTNIVALPFKAREASLTTLLDRRNGEILDVLAIDPW